MRVVRDFNWVTEKGYFSRLSYGSGLNLFLLDTGTVIDMEQNYANNCHSGQIPFQILDRISMQVPIIILPGVFKEISTHRKVRKGKNHRKEITDPTFNLIKGLYEDSMDFLNDNEAQRLGIKLKKKLISLDSTLSFDLSVDNVRYMVHNATIAAFREDYRKGEKDVISKTDKEILLTALLLSRGNYHGEKVDCVNVLSNDSHLAKTIKFLNEFQALNQHRVRAIPTRSDLRSYLK